MTSSDLNQAIKSTIDALDQFEQIGELQELVKLAYEQFDNNTITTQDIKSRTDLLIGIYLRNTDEYIINVKNHLKEIQSVLTKARS